MWSHTRSRSSPCRRRPPRPISSATPRRRASTSRGAPHGPGGAGGACAGSAALRPAETRAAARSRRSSRLGELVGRRPRAPACRCVVIEEGEPPEMPPGVGLAAYRILQEALANVSRHAGAVSRGRARRATRRTLIELAGHEPGRRPRGCAPGHGDGIRRDARARADVYGGSTEAGFESGGTSSRSGPGCRSSCRSRAGPRGTARGTRSASSAQRSRERCGSTVSIACSSATPAVERLLAAEAGGDLQRLAPVVAERREDVDEEVAVRDRLADLQRGVPGGEHRQVVLVEVGDGLARSATRARARGSRRPTRERARRAAAAAPRGRRTRR